jgi:hypothetical protein
MPHIAPDERSDVRGLIVPLSLLSFLGVLKARLISPRDISDRNRCGVSLEEASTHLQMHVVCGALLVSRCKFSPSHNGFANGESSVSRLPAKCAPLDFLSHPFG